MGTIRSGLPMCHRCESSNWRGGGISAGLPSGAPPSTQATIVAISSSVSEGSSLNRRIPTLRSINHGGMSRVTTFAFIARAQGRASRYVSRDMGAMLSGRWHFWQARCRIGATSFVNVTWPLGPDFAAVWAPALSIELNIAARATKPAADQNKRQCWRGDFLILMVAPAANRFHYATAERFSTELDRC